MIVGKLMVVLGLDSKGFNTGLNSATKKTTLFAKASDKTFKAIGRAAKIGLLAVSAAFIKGTYDAAKFEKALANVSTMLDKTTMPLMKDFKKGILDLAQSYGESTDALAKGLYDILSASIPAAKAMDVLKTSAMAAKAGLTNTGVAADAITTLMNSFGDATKSAQYWSDILFSTVKFGKSTFAELAPVIGNVAKLMSVAGGTGEDMAGMLSIMTRNGIKTRVAITSLRGVISALLRPSDALTKELGGMTAKADGFRAVMDKIGSLPATDLAKMFPNVRALTGIVVAAKGLGKEVDKITGLMKEGSPTFIAFEKQSKTLAFIWNKLKATFKATSIAVGDELLPTMKEIFTGLIGWLKENREGFAEFAKSTVEAIKNIVTTIIQLKEILMGVGTAILSVMIVQKVTKAMALFGIATSVSLGPVAAIGAAVGLLIAGFIKLKNELKAEKEEQNLLNDAMKGNLKTTEDYNKALKIQRDKINAIVDIQKDSNKRLEESGLVTKAQMRIAKQSYESNIRYEQGRLTAMIRNATKQKKIEDNEKAVAQNKATREQKAFLKQQARAAKEMADAQAAANVLRLKENEIKMIREALIKASETEKQKYDREKKHLEDLGLSHQEVIEYLTIKFPKATAVAGKASHEFWNDQEGFVNVFASEFKNTTKKTKSSWGKFTDYLKDNWSGFMDSLIGSFKNAMGSIMTLMSQSADAQIAAIEKQYGAKTQAELEYQAFLDAQKDKDKQDQKNKLVQLKKDLAAETDAKKRAELKKQISALETSMKESTLAKKSADSRVKADKDAADKILKIKQTLAKKEKAIQITMAIVNTASAIIHSLYDPGGFPGAAMAIAAGITGALEVATIKAQPIPMIRGGAVDSLISGGVFSGKPGIDTNTIKVTSGEYIMPPQQTIDNISELEAMRAGGGGKSITVNPMALNIEIAGRNVFNGIVEFMTEGSDRGEYRINPKVLGVLT